MCPDCLTLLPPSRCGNLPSLEDVAVIPRDPAGDRTMAAGTGSPTHMHPSARVWETPGIKQRQTGWTPVTRMSTCVEVFTHAPPSARAKQPVVTQAFQSGDPISPCKRLALSYFLPLGTPSHQCPLRAEQFSRWRLGSFCSLALHNPQNHRGVGGRVPG